MKKYIILSLIFLFTFVFISPLKAQDNPLISAITNGNLKEVKTLFKTSNNEDNKWREKSLLVAVIENQYKIAKFLLSQGEDPNVIFDGITSPLLGAIEHGNIKMVKLLIANGANVDLGITETPLVFLLKECSFYPNKSVSLKEKAISYNLKTKKKIMNILITNGADVNAKDCDGFTPLDLVEKFYPDTEEMKQILIKHGAKIGKDLK